MSAPGWASGQATGPQVEWRTTMPRRQTMAAPAIYDGTVCPDCNRIAYPNAGGHIVGCQYGQPAHPRGCCPDRPATT